ncbi:MAG: phosphoserine phosphatase SerB [Gammaproteobacteria bacterium]|nr:phosphoserine phosphatase SerB [Gammaproteobacteria bacterium]MDH5801568.1 phosphoserine phosphatase SerB [Gammaproteobacteria bacterium]
MSIVVVHNQALDPAHSPNPSALQSIESVLGVALEDRGLYYRAQIPQSLDQTVLQKFRSELGVDINDIPETLDIRLLISDMDSTLISIECVDEIADFAGKKAQVAAVTEAAMRGELDFNASLQQRVAALKDLSVDVLQQVYERRLRLNPGARELVAGMKANRAKVALVSGGFTFFTARIREELDLDYVLANELDISDGKLSGQVSGEIVNAEVKARFLKQICIEERISTQQAIAVGDGANDLKMMQEAALGVAYHAKPTVQQQANVVLNYHGLDAILHLIQASKS